MNDNETKKVEQMILDYKYYNSNFVPNVFGLSNTGSICWCNAMLQALLSCSSFNERMLENEEAMKHNIVAKCYIKILKQTLSAYKENTNTADVKIASTHLLNAMVDKLKKLNRNSDIMTIGQKDPVEGFLMLMDLLESSYVVNLFNHRYSSQSYCISCDAISYENNNEPANIVMNMHMNGNIKNADDFIRNIEVKPVVINNYKCDKCNKELKITYMIYKLKLLREIVLITISNVNTGGMISKEYINYFKEFKIQDILGNELKYKLVAEINHHGIQTEITGEQNGKLYKMYRSSGHYTAKCLRGDNYYIFDDTNVMKSEFEVSKKSYVLIYHLF